MSDKIVVNEELCTGCRSCEIACSYHHLHVFDPSISSIMVKRDFVKGVIDIEVLRNSYNTHLPCDLCINEIDPFCVKYCSCSAITLLKGDEEG